MPKSRFHSLGAWFGLAVGWFVLAYAILMFAQIEFLALIALWIAGWFFVVWTVALGARVGTGR